MNTNEIITAADADDVVLLSHDEVCAELCAALLALIAESEAANDA